MKENIASEVKIIPGIMSFFSLPAPKDITRINFGFSHNYIVKTVQNDYVVRFLVSKSIHDIENEMAIQNQLKASGIVTPIYIKTKGGRYIFSNKDVKVVISKKIEGAVPLKTNLKLAKDFGKKLAIFHKSVTALPHSNEGSMNPKVSGIASPIFDQSLPKGIIHGDFHLSNALVDTTDQDEIVAVLDFEEAEENLYIVDLGTTIMAICTPSKSSTLFDPDLMQAVLDGYESVRKLSDQEKQWLPSAMKYAHQVWIKWFKDNGQDDYAEKHQKRLDNFISLISEKPKELLSFKP